MGIQAGRARRTTGAGFTLVELLLVVALLLLLFGAVVFNFNTLQRGAQLDEGAGQVETLLRFARAQAAATGRQVRVVLGEFPATATGGTNAVPVTGSPAASPTGAAGGTGAGLGSAGGTNLMAAEGGIVVGWEPDPLGAPGRFELLREAVPFTEQLAALVRVREVRVPGANSSASGGRGAGFGAGESAVAEAAVPPSSGDDSMPRDNAAASGTGGPAVTQITFYPDGSSDTVEIVLESQDDDDRRRVLVSLAGVTGVIRRRALATPEAEGRPENPATAENPVPALTEAGPVTLPAK